MRLLDRLRFIDEAGCIVLRHVLPDRDCRSLVEEIEADPGKPTEAGVKEDGYRDAVQPELSRSHTSDGSGWMVRRVMQAVKDEQPKLERFFGKPLELSSELHFRTYEVGDFIVAHIDQIEDAPTRISEREAIWTLLLNDDYEGGELVLHVSDSEFASKPEAGKLIVFRGRTPHSVREVTAGTRYSVTGWFRCPS